MSTNARIAVYTVAATALLAGSCLLPSGPSTAQAQVLPPIQDTLRRPIDRGLDRVDRAGSRIRRNVDEVNDEVVEPTVDEADEAMEKAGNVPATAVEEAGQTVRGATESAIPATGRVLAGATAAVSNVLRPLVLDADPSGWPIEKNTIVLLLDGQDLATIMQSGARPGLEVISQRDLGALGLTLVTLRQSTVPTPHMLNDIRQAHPDVTVDFNHIYRFASEPDPAEASGGVEEASDEQDMETAGVALRVGMIDSAVLHDHPSLRDSRLVSNDFVAHEGVRPLGHGTAVASIIARSAANLAEIHAASVFFEMPGFAPGATTESLVAALDWLASQQVDAINMSLAGPANALLEEALASMVRTGPMVIAAVGNNGPSGEPLYPAAYDGVIAVTAVDREKKIFLYANRGEHVDYAALGVGVKVADSGGSWRVESGTSMASPHVAVVIAGMRRSGDMARQALLEVLTANAEDLGKTGFDRVFGHGLITEPPVLVSGSHQEMSQVPAESGPRN